MKKIGMIALVLLLVVSLAACRSGKADETTAPTTTAPTTIAPTTTAPTTAPTTMPTILPTIDPTIDTNIPDPDVDSNSTMDTETTENGMTERHRMMPGMDHR